MRPIQIPRIKRVVDAGLNVYINFEKIHTEFSICFFKSIPSAFKSLSLYRQIFNSFMT